MEGIVTYEESYEYLKILSKDLLTNQPITINWAKLDTDSAGVIMKALSEAISKRSSSVYNIIASNSSQLLQ